MNVIYKMLPYSILLIVAGFLIGMASGESVLGYIGLGLIIASGVVTLGVVLIITLKHWRLNKATTDKRLSEVSVTLIFNAVIALLLFSYVTWKDIVILNDDNMFLIIWMAVNLGALRVLWVPKETESTPTVQVEVVEDEKNKEAV